MRHCAQWSLLGVLKEPQSRTCFLILNPTVTLLLLPPPACTCVVSVKPVHLSRYEKLPESLKGTSYHPCEHTYSDHASACHLDHGMPPEIGWFLAAQPALQPQLRMEGGAHDLSDRINQCCNKCICMCGS